MIPITFAFTFDVELSTFNLKSSAFNFLFNFTEFFTHGLKLQTNLFGATFYVLTGFHGTHVTVGVIWLWSLFSMASRGQLGPDRALDVEIAGLYWHFVDVVWIAIFTLIYLIQ